MQYTYLMLPGVVAGFLVMVLGGMMAVRPDIMMRLQIWTQRVIMGAQYIPSKRTYKMMRFIGATVMVVGLAVIVGIITES